MRGIGRWRTVINLPRRMEVQLDAIKEVCHTEKVTALLWTRIRDMIVEAVPADVSTFAIMDPVSGLVTDGYAFGAQPELSYTYISQFYLRRELYSYLDQRADRRVLSLLSETTGGYLEKDPLYRDFLRSEGFKHEVKISFVAGHYYWGGFCAIRGNDVRDFGEVELAFLRHLVKPVGEALRTAMVWQLAHARTPDDTLPDAGVILLDTSHRVLFRTDGISSILKDIAAPDHHSADGRLDKMGALLPASIHGTYGHLRAVRDHMWDCVSPSVTVRGLTRWWTITATVPEPEMPKDVAAVLIIARAHPGDTANVLLAAYDLTPREEEIVRLVRLGLSTVAIARRIYVSTYTVQDHLKSIFTKVGVRTRGELMAVIFREESPLGRSLDQEGLPPSPNS